MLYLYIMYTYMLLQSNNIEVERNNNTAFMI